jgi:hypothetical protein
MRVANVNGLLWASTLCILWGLAGLFVGMVSPSTELTPAGLPPATLLTIGLFAALIGQLLFRLALRVEAMERRGGDADRTTPPAD